jgi:hypothetical protein
VAGVSFLSFALPFIALIAGAISAPLSSRAEERPEESRAPALNVTRTPSTIRIDGSLDDEGWLGALTVDLPYEIMPGENIPAPVSTDCKIAYDDHHLYLGFHAVDPRPEEIRARVTDRDAHQADDAVGLFIDTFNDERRAFEFLVNPLGVQTDISRSDVADGEGEPEDTTWDAIWHTQGKLTDDGYIVEMVIPFASLRFPRAQGVQTWGMTLFRNYPRDVRHQIASAPYDRNRSCMICQYPKVTGFAGIRPGRSLEFDPTVTMHRMDLRDEHADAAMRNGPLKGDAGVSMRWGATPNLSINAAVNPDFSQVEADAAQLNVNTRYALYFDEKRPLFLEGADFFRTAFTAVHTRTVADPIWGLKATGKEASNAIGVFMTRDQRLNLLFPSNQGSDDASLEREVTGAVLRYRRDIGSSSTLGILATDREAGDYHNRVAGADGHLRLGETETVRFQFLGSSTRYPDAAVADLADENPQPDGSFDGVAGALGYDHGSRNWNWSVSYADLGKDFRADAGFVPRVDTREVAGEFEHVWYGRDGSWFNQINTGVEASRVEDHDGILTDLNLEAVANLQGRMQSYLRPVYERRRERYFSYERSDSLSYRYAYYDQNWYQLRFGARPTGRFNFWGVVAYGDAIDYDNGRAGKKHWGGPGFSFDVGRHFQFFVDHTYEAMKLDDNGKRLYLANLVQSRIVYQMNVRTFARALVQYTDLSFQQKRYTFAMPPGYHELFSQVLLSYKINPQTVFYLGYSETRSGDQGHEIRQMDCTFFGKIGYAWLI